MQWFVGIKVKGYFDKSIEADTKEEAIRKAEKLYNEADFGELSDMEMEVYDAYIDKNYVEGE